MNTPNEQEEDAERNEHVLEERHGKRARQRLVADRT